MTGPYPDDPNRSVRSTTTILVGELSRRIRRASGIEWPVLRQCQHVQEEVAPGTQWLHPDAEHVRLVERYLDRLARLVVPLHRYILHEPGGRLTRDGHPTPWPPAEVLTTMIVCRLTRIEP